MLSLPDEGIYVTANSSDTFAQKLDSPRAERCEIGSNGAQLFFASLSATQSKDPDFLVRSWFETQPTFMWHGSAPLTDVVMRLLCTMGKPCWHLVGNSAASPRTSFSVRHRFAWRRVVSMSDMQAYVRMALVYGICRCWQVGYGTPRQVDQMIFQLIHTRNQFVRGEGPGALSRLWLGSSGTSTGWSELNTCRKFCTSFASKEAQLPRGDNQFAIQLRLTLG